MDEKPSIVLSKQSSLQEDIVVNNPEISKNYANFEIKKSSIKWLVIFGVVLFVAFLGLLLGSVLLGVKVTKDVEVRDGELVFGKDKTTVVKTSEKIYTHTVTLDTPLEVIQEVKTISIFVPQSGDNTAGSAGVFKFKVVGFERIAGRKLVFHGHTHHADVQQDGSIKIIQAFASNNKRSVQIRDGTYATVESLVAAVPTIVYQSISNCNQLKSMNPTGRYKLTQNLACTLYAVLPTFKGIFNGQGYTLTITMDVGNKEVALFNKLERANIFNLNVAGSFSGASTCAVYAIEATAGTVLLSNKASASVNCGKKGNNRILAAAFVANILANSGSDAITFHYLLSASTITVPSNVNAVLGGFFALADTNQAIVSKHNYFFSFFPNIPVPSQFSVIGMKMNSKKRDPCGNIYDPDYNAYCWQLFNYSSSTGQANPYSNYFQCCAGWNPCAGCMFDPDPAGCRFALCYYGKRSLREGDSSSVKRITPSEVANYVHIPFIQADCFTNIPE